MTNGCLMSPLISLPHDVGGLVSVKQAVEHLDLEIGFGFPIPERRSSKARSR